jgi:hypothetical protein
MGGCHAECHEAPRGSQRLRPFALLRVTWGTVQANLVLGPWGDFQIYTREVLRASHLPRPYPEDPGATVFKWRYE